MSDIHNQLRGLPTRMVQDDGADHWSRKVDEGGWSEEIADFWGRKFDWGRKPHAFPSLFRASMAGSCLAQLYYYATSKETDSPTRADLYRMNVGTVIHDFLQDHDLWGRDAHFEQSFKLGKFNDVALVSGSTDVWLPETSHLIELKSTGGFAFKKTAIFNNAEGPRDSHLRQTALAAKALNAKSVSLIYVGMEVVGRGDTDKYGCTDNQRWLAEYTYSGTELLSLANDELARMTRVAGYVKNKTTPPRHIPDMPVDAEINRSKPPSGKPTWTIVSDGVVTDTGTHWACDYCRFQTQCQEDIDRHL